MLLLLVVFVVIISKNSEEVWKHAVSDAVKNQVYICVYILYVYVCMNECAYVIGYSSAVPCILSTSKNPDQFVQNSHGTSNNCVFEDQVNRRSTQWLRPGNSLTLLLLYSLQ